MRSNILIVDKDIHTDSPTLKFDPIIDKYILAT